MKLTCLNFVPTEEHIALIQKGDHDALLDLAYFHNVLFLPLLHIWYCAEPENQDVEAYRCGYIDAETCQWRLPAPMWTGEVSKKGAWR